MAIIGRNGTGKSTLLQILSGELQPDSGTVWRQPGTRVARLVQDVPLSAHAPVFDVVAEGLGDLAELIRAYHHATVEIEHDHSPEALARLGELQHELEERDGWSLEQRVELVLDTPRPAGRRHRRHAVRRLEAPRAAGAGAGRAARSAAARRADQSPRHRRRSTGWKRSCRSTPGAVRLRHARPRVPRAPGDAHRRARSRPLTVVARRLRRPSCARRRSGWPTRRRSQARSSTRSWREEEVWIRQGIKARRTRNEGRVQGADGDARGARRTAGCKPGSVQAAADRAPSPRARLVFEAEGRAQGLRRHAWSSTTSRRASCAATASA